MQNRRLWVNARIQALESAIKVLRLDYLAERNEDSVADTIEQLKAELDKFSGDLSYRPFTHTRNSTVGKDA